MLPFLALGAALVALAIIAPSGNKAENIEEKNQMSKKLRKKLDAREIDTGEIDAGEIDATEIDADEIDAKISALENSTAE